MSFFIIRFTATLIELLNRPAKTVPKRPRRTQLSSGAKLNFPIFSILFYLDKDFKNNKKNSNGIFLKWFLHVKEILNNKINRKTKKKCWISHYYATYQATNRRLFVLTCSSRRLDCGRQRFPVFLNKLINYLTHLGLYLSYSRARRAIIFIALTTFNERISTLRIFQGFWQDEETRLNWAKTIWRLKKKSQVAYIDLLLVDKKNHYVSECVYAINMSTLLNDQCPLFFFYRKKHLFSVGKPWQKYVISLPTPNLLFQYFLF